MDLEEEDHRCKAKGAKSRSLCGGLLPVWFTTAFWVPAKPLHLRSMLSKLMRCMKTTMAAAGLGQQKGPNSSPRQRSNAHCTTNALLQKLNELGFKVLPHPPHSPDLSPTNYHFFKHLSNFLQEKPFHNQQEEENGFQKSSSNPKVWIFTWQE